MGAKSSGSAGTGYNRARRAPNATPIGIALSPSSVDENKPTGTEVGRFTTADPDAGDTHTYTLVSGAGDGDNGSFETDGSTLRTRTEFDFERRASYSIRVRTSDERGAQFEKTFRITVEDVAEAPPNQAPTDIALSGATLAENEPAGTSVGSLSTTDSDAGDTHTYQLVAGAGDDDNGSFRISGSTLETDAVLDHEAAQSGYSVRVRTTDNKGATFEKTFTITVTDVNEPPTAISLSPSSVDENEPAGTEVGTLSASDPDSGDSHSYQLVSGAGDDDNGSFEIDGSKLKTKASFDREANASLSIRVRTSDGRGGTFEKDLAIDVDDVNEPPTAISLSPSSVAENEAAGTEVGTLSASDPDSGDSHSYQLVSGAGAADNASFEVDGSKLKTKASFNFEQKSSYSVRVRADDGSGATFEKELTVTVTDLNEPPTAISLSPSSVAENEPAGTEVGTLSASDPDSGDSHSYQLVSGAGDADNASFEVDGSKLKTKASFDFEQKSSYSVRVKVDDSQGATFEKELTVTVTDLNDPPTDIALSPSSVDENEAAGTEVGTLSATDPDSPTHTYTLVPGAGAADNASFQIDGDKLKTNASFNFEQKSSYSVRVRADDGSGGTFEKELTITVNNVNDLPRATADSYGGAIGNTKAQVQRSGSGPVVTLTGDVITQNDADEDTGDSLSAVPETVTSTGGGSATVHSDGSFTFLPGVGDKNQTDSFSYKVTDGEAQSTGTVQVGIVNELVWYVDRDAASNGDGRSTAPFNTLVDLSGAGGSGDADGQGDTLFLYSASSSYGGGLPLEPSQDLIGEPEGLTVNNGSGNVALVAPAGSNPVITNANPGGDGVVLANGVTMRRVSVANTSDDGITGSGVGSADIGPNLSVNGASGVGFELLGGNGTVAFGGSIANSGARQVEVQNRTGGAVTLSGAISGTGSGVLAHNNGGATVNFTSGSVQLNTGSSDAFRATGGGTVNVTGANNTLTATSGSGLFVQNTTIGASGLNFKSIASNGGSSTGIVLDNTGSSGGLTVTGSGTTPGSGGTIANKTGGDGSNTTGVGVYLNNTKDVSLSRMQLNDFDNFAVRGTTVDGFTLANSVVSATSTAGDCTADNANGDSAALDEGSLSFTGLTGAASLAGSSISGACKDNLRVENSGGTLNRLVLNDTTIGANNTNQGNDGVLLEATGGVFNVTVENDSDFTSARGDLFQLGVVGNAQSDLDFTGNDLSNNHPAIAQGGGGVTIGAANSGDLTYDVTGNDLRDSLGTALAIGKGFGGAPGDGTATGKIESNVVGVSGVPNSGSEAGSGIEVGELARGSHTTLIKNNQVRGYSNFGVLLSVGGAAETVTGLTHDGVMNATVQGNTIAQPNAPSGGLAQNGIHANVGTNAGDDYQVCLGLGDTSDPGKKNTVTGSGALGGTDYRLRQRFDTDVRMPGYTGVANDPGATGALDTALTSYLTPRTSGPFTLSSSSTSTGGFFNTSGGAACPQP